MAKSYPIIGGPLDGQRANYKDFAAATYSYVKQGSRPTKDKMVTPAGVFYAEQDEYVAFNRGDRYKDVPTMIWLWRKLLP